MVPTFLFWTAFVTAAFALFRNRYAVYGLGLAMLIYTVYRMNVGDALSWVTNWIAWNSMIFWSDMGTFSLDGRTLLLNRLLYLSLTPLFLALALKWLGRQEFDATRILHRLRPRAVLRSGVRLLPFALAPAALSLGAVLRRPGGRPGPGRRGGPQGLLAAQRGDLDRLSDAIGFARGSGRGSGAGELALPRCPAPTRSSTTATTRTPSFRSPRDPGTRSRGPWTGNPYEPEDRAGLYVFSPAGAARSRRFADGRFRVRAAVPPAA